MPDLSEKEVAELERFTQGDAKLSSLLQSAIDEFDRTGKVGPVKERLKKVKGRKNRG